MLLATETQNTCAVAPTTSMLTPTSQRLKNPLAAAVKQCGKRPKELLPLTLERFTSTLLRTLPIVPYIPTMCPRFLSHSLRLRSFVVVVKVTRYTKETRSRLHFTIGSDVWGVGDPRA